MKHDDLCPDKIQQNWATCWTCDVIARVREDEQKHLGNIYEKQSEVDWQAGYGWGLSDAREAVLAYADERLEMTRYPNKSEDITAALRVAARRIDGLQSATRTLPDPHDSSDIGTEVPTTPGGAP